MIVIININMYFMNPTLRDPPKVTRERVKFFLKINITLKKEMAIGKLKRKV